MTRRSLELVRTLREGKRDGSLLSVIDCTATPMGARLLAEWLTSPLTSIRADRRAARRRRGAARRSRSSAATCGRMLGQSYDLERLAARVGTGRATPRDLVALARTLALLPKVKARLTARRLASGSTSSRRRSSSARRSVPRSRRPWSTTRRWPSRKAGLIRDGYHPELDELRADAKGGKSWIARFQAEQIRRTGHPQPQGRLQQGLRLLHRDHARPGPGPRREHSRATTSASRRSRTPSATSRPS